MAHYEARVVETIEYQVFVEAADHNEAKTKAEELILDADDPNAYLFAVHDRNVEHVKQLDRPQPLNTTQPNS